MKRRKKHEHASEQKLDGLFSQLIRSRGKCERCGKTGRLETSHFYGRRKRSVRWSVINCFCLCNGCHRHFHEHPYEHYCWVLSRLGEDKFNELRHLANTHVKCNKAYREVLLEWLEKELA